MEHLSKEFWSERYQNDNTGWDLGQISKPIKEYFDQIKDKSIRILIPGCGNGHEAEYLFNDGFINVNVIDITEEPLLDLKNRVPGLKHNQVHLGDFFEHCGEYDLIVEQTMFCAINPSLRQSYATKASDLLTPKGKLVGVMFNREFEAGPPFGGNKEEYTSYFKDSFEKLSFEECYNSVGPRKGSELFVKMEKG